MSNSPIARTTVTNVLPGTEQGQTLRWDTGAVQWQATSSLTVDDSSIVKIEGVTAGLRVNRIGGNDPFIQMQVDSTSVARINGEVGGGASFTLGGTSDTVFMYDSVGNVGIGTTTPDSLLHLSLGGTTDQGEVAMTIGNDSVTARQARIVKNTSTPYELKIRSKADAGGNGVPITFETKLDGEAMRIDATGNVGIGDTNPTRAKLSVLLDDTDESVYFYGGGLRGLQINDVTNGNAGDHTRFFKGSSTALWSWSNSVREQMRLDANGNLLVGTTSSIARLGAQSAGTTSATFAIQARNSASTILFYVRSDGYTSTGAAASSPYNQAVTGRDLIVSSTGILGTASSVRRSKTNIQPLEGSFISRLEPVQFNYREQDESGEYTDRAIDELEYGLIAEDVELINKDLCAYDSEGVLAGVHYRKLVPVLVKAIQELTARVEALEA